MSFSKRRPLCISLGRRRDSQLHLIALRQWYYSPSSMITMQLLFVHCKTTDGKYNNNYSCCYNYYRPIVWEQLICSPKIMLTLDFFSRSLDRICRQWRCTQALIGSHWCQKQLAHNFNFTSCQCVFTLSWSCKCFVNGIQVLEDLVLN